MTGRSDKQIISQALGSLPEDDLAWVENGIRQAFGLQERALRSPSVGSVGPFADVSAQRPQKG